VHGLGLGEAQQLLHALLAAEAGGLQPAERGADEVAGRDVVLIDESFAAVPEPLLRAR